MEMNLQQPAYFYPNLMGRIILLALEEILGGNGVNATLNLASLSNLIDNYPPHNRNMEFRFQSISRLHSTLDDIYGPRGGRGVALRAGRACFQYGLREFGPLFGLTNLTFRLLPLQTKLKLGASAFADIFNQYSDQRVHLEDKGKRIFLHIERCPLCWDRHVDFPSCHMAVGVLQEALTWVSGGKYFNIEETHCIGCGDSTCTIMIDKTPMS
jgi:predicted hydrocarbon binding protein